VPVITVSVVIVIKNRKKILSRKVDTRHYTKPPAGNWCCQNECVHIYVALLLLLKVNSYCSDQQQFKYDLLPVYAEHDRDFVEKNFLTPLDKNVYVILNHHLNLCLIML